MVIFTFDLVTKWIEKSLLLNEHFTKETFYGFWIPLNTITIVLYK